jgi:hypothetical protein
MPYCPSTKKYLNGQFRFGNSATLLAVKGLLPVLARNTAHYCPVTAFVAKSMRANDRYSLYRLTVTGRMVSDVHRLATTAISLQETFQAKNSMSAPAALPKFITL